jgi:hypothetical protein
MVELEDIQPGERFLPFNGFYFTNPDALPRKK